MSTFRTPVGPQPSGVYWRRRLIVGLGLLAVLVVIVLIVARPGSAPPKPAASNTPTAPASPAAVAACKPANVQIEAITDANSYAAGIDPMLSLAITNTGTTACTINAGTDVQEYLITSGSERIWSSKDCQTGAAPLPVRLEPGTPVGSTPITWDRTRSSTTTCESKRPKVIAGGASYHLTVIVDGVSSAQSKQFVLK